MDIKDLELLEKKVSEQYEECNTGAKVLLKKVKKSCEAGEAPPELLESVIKACNNLAYIIGPELINAVPKLEGPTLEKQGDAVIKSYAEIRTGLGDTISILKIDANEVKDVPGKVEKLESNLGALDNAIKSLLEKLGQPAPAVASA